METLGYFDTKIQFQLGRQSTEPNFLWKQPKTSLSNDDKLIFGKLLQLEKKSSETFGDIIIYLFHCGAS